MTKTHTESHITVTFTISDHGERQVSIVCALEFDAVTLTIRAAKSALLEGVKGFDFQGLDPCAVLNFSLSAWLLEEESLVDSTITIGCTEIVKSQEELVAKCESLTDLVFPRFRKALEQSEISL